MGALCITANIAFGCRLGFSRCTCAKSAECPLEASVGGKWLKVLKEIAPGTARVAILFNPKTAPQSYYYLKTLQVSAQTLGLTLTATQVASAQDIEAAINDLAKFPNGGFVIMLDIFTAAKTQRDLIISLAARRAPPPRNPQTG